MLKYFTTAIYIHVFTSAFHVCDTAILLTVLKVSVPSERAIELARKLLAVHPVRLAGLGARDILRLEAGLCLYGSDITEETTPVEAGLSWCISRCLETISYCSVQNVVIYFQARGVHLRVAL